MNRIFVPSGDQAGSSSQEGVLVNRVWSEPSAFMTHRSMSPARSLANTIFDPSGDQPGIESHAVFIVNGWMFAPDGSTV